MNKTEIMNKMIKKNNGYLYAKEVEEQHISRTFLAWFVKENKLERVAKGIYVSPDVNHDELFVLQKRYPKVIYAGETALKLHGLMDDKNSEPRVSVPQGFSGTRLRESGVIIHQEKKDNYEMGIIEVETDCGNVVRCYDRERCVCELVRNREKVDDDSFQNTIVEYMSDENKNLSRLVEYAKKLGVYDDVTKVIDDKLEEANIRDRAEGGPIMTLEEKNEIANKHYLEEGIKIGREETKEKVREEHIRHLKNYIELIKKGVITKETVIDEFGYTKEEVEEMMQD